MASYLINDFGIANTRTVLIDTVEGQHRFIIGSMTRSTVPPPTSDATVAIERNIERLEQMTGRVFLSEGGFADTLVVTASSAGRPLRAVLLGLMELSLQSARRALTGTYIDAVVTIKLSESASDEEHINKILSQQPDVILLVGGTDDGNEEQVRQLIHLVELAVKLVPRDRRPIVLYAGNARLKGMVRERIEPHAMTFLADNVRPTLEEEALTSVRLKLAQVFDHFLERQPGGFRELSEFSQTGIIPTAQAGMNIIRFLDTLGEQAAIYVDVGSGTSSVLTSAQGQALVNIESTLGLGHNVLNVLQTLDWRDVSRWLPFPLTLTQFEEWVHNKSLNPTTIPQTIYDLFLEYAAAREIVRWLMKQIQFERTEAGLEPLRDFSPLIAGGAVFTANLSPNLAAMILLDALEPTGIVNLWQDPYALASALGAVSYIDPSAVVQVIDNGCFARLGTAICPTGTVRRPGAKMEVRITLPNNNVIEHQVEPGDIWIPTLPPNVMVEVEVRVPAGMSLGNGQRKIRQSFRTGTAGMIFDMRGRPLRMPQGRRRRQTIGRWYEAVTGIHLDEKMYEEPEPAATLAEMGASIEAPTAAFDVEFPDYGKLPDGRLSPEFTTLLESAGAEEEGIDDLAKELGLR